MTTLAELGAAAAALRGLFDDREGEERARLLGPESQRNFSYPNLPVGTAWLRQKRTELERLLAAGFRLTLGLAMPEVGVRCELRGAPGWIEVRATGAFPDPVAALANALPLFNRLRNLLTEPPSTPGSAPRPGAGAELAELLDFLDGPSAPSSGGPQDGPRVQDRLELEQTLSFVLDKPNALGQAGIETDAEGLQVRAFLFPESLAASLAVETPRGLERGGLFQGRCRTVLIVLAAEGRLAGDYIEVLGSDQEATVRAAGPLEAALLQRSEETLKFRSQRCAWQDQTSWLVPDALAVSPSASGGVPPALAVVGDELQRLRALLALLFVADETRMHPDGFEVFFRRGRDQGLVVSRTRLEESRCSADGLIGLYEFAYGDLKPEKLEIVRRTLDRQALNDAADLCSSAEKALAAAEQVLGNYLKDRVGEYFAARQQTQEYVRKVLLEVESATLDLTRSVSENAYKTAGVVAAAIVTGLLKPEARRLTTGLAGGVIVAYLALILHYYFPTMWQTWNVRKKRFEDHIDSFRDLLGEKETSKLLDDPRVAEAQQIFEDKLKGAERIYRWTLVAVGLGVLYVLAGGPMP